MSGSITSAVTNIQFLDNIAIQIDYSGTLPVGNIIVEASSNHQQDAQGVTTVAGTWVDLGLGLTAPTSTTPIYVDVNQLSAPYIRVRYARTSGTGTMNAVISAKEV